MFDDGRSTSGCASSAINSINWARVMAQTVYYVTAPGALGRANTASVPTGNFGNVLAG